MKKLSILFLSVLALGLSVSSCNSDDDNGGVSGSIEGKWEASEFGVIVNGKETLQPVVEPGGCAKSITEFSKDGKFIDTYSEYANSKCSSYTDNGTYTVSEGKLKLKYEGETEEDVSEIVELTATKLKTKVTYTEGGQTFSEVYVYIKK